MVARAPSPSVFKVLVDGKPVMVTGWASSAALAVAQDGETYASAMLLSGGVLARGFETLDAAHAFNLAVAQEKKLHPGALDLQEFYARAGGLAAAKKLVEAIRKKLSKEKTK